MVDIEGSRGNVPIFMQSADLLHLKGFWASFNTEGKH